jgi:hypothetical protein
MFQTTNQGMKWTSSWWILLVKWTWTSFHDMKTIIKINSTRCSWKNTTHHFTFIIKSGKQWSSKLNTLAHPHLNQSRGEGLRFLSHSTLIFIKTSKNDQRSFLAVNIKHADLRNKHQNQQKPESWWGYWKHTGNHIQQIFGIQNWAMFHA